MCEVRYVSCAKQKRVEACWRGRRATNDDDVEDIHVSFSLNFNERFK